MLLFFFEKGHKKELTHFIKCVSFFFQTKMKRKRNIEYFVKMSKNAGKKNWFCNRYWSKKKFLLLFRILDVTLLPVAIVCPHFVTVIWPKNLTESWIGGKIYLASMNRKKKIIYWAQHQPTRSVQIIICRFHLISFLKNLFEIRININVANSSKL